MLSREFEVWVTLDLLPGLDPETTPEKTTKKRKKCCGGWVLVLEMS